MPVISPPMRKEILRGARCAKSFAGLTTLAAMFVASVARQSANIATTSTIGFVNFVSTSTGSQIVCAVDDRRRRCHRDADERIERHRQRQAERLADDLIALRARVTREVRDVERERRPEADHAGQRRE